MASADSPASLQSWLNQATDPINEEDRWDCIQGFYELVNQESDGPQVALRLLAHKIQSPQEKESLQALTVLEACMNNCGKRFHAEAAKFRFLNELIKILTPKYFGAWSPQKVKDRVTEVLYGWTLWLKDEPKIQEAYSMLKKQGIVEKDPKLPDKVVMAPLPQRHSESVFDQEDKSKLLSRLLKSARPEDLETANRLIKNTVREEQEKAEKVSKRESTLKEVESSAKQLRELLERHRDSGTSLQHRDDLKAVYERCDRLRPSLFRLASDTVDDDGALAQILAANDELTLAVNAYKERVGRGEQNGGGARSRGEEALSQDIVPMSPRGIKSYHLIDLSALDSPQTHRSADSPSAFQSSSPDCSSQSESQPGLNESDSPSKPNQCHPKSYYEELMQLDGDIHTESTDQNGGRGLILRSRGCGDGSMSNGFLPQSQQFTDSGSASKKQANDVSSLRLEQILCPPHLLKNVFVPVEAIVFSQLEPITLYDRDGIRVSLHFARDCPPGHPGVAVVVMSAVNTSALHVKGLTFQAAVPKSMLVKLQPASGTDLPPYNPLLPPPAISQVLLLANPHSCSVRLRYKLTLTHGEQRLDETGDVSRFPDWSSLIGLRAAK
ncbi:ADP-ribosylation factor-binding protein GGA3-like [Salarias fasciatus]|uniref:ADP-ribosylation factor-binding protein GGA3-like n=1 Tax=Salarias fasciatus TaxID=181472 RepID=A0A672GAI0_SALFA|nr:ADP-ribosylation factor-binding protein GGA3-like [Salarias fasciatus]